MVVLLEMHRPEAVDKQISVRQIIILGTGVAVPPSKLSLAIITLAVGALTACGGGSSGSSSPPPPAPDFMLNVSAQSIALNATNSVPLVVSVTALNGFTGQVAISITGIPAPAMANSTSFVLSAGGQNQVNFTAPTATSDANATVTVQGTSGTLTHSAMLPLSIVLPATSGHAAVRTRYLRTDAYYNPNALQYAPPHFTVYDAKDKRFFVSNPYLNRIDVFDAIHETQVAQIVVPGAWGLDISPDNTKIYAGTLVGDVYQIDPVQMQVVTRTPTATIGLHGFQATEAFVLADGRLALLGAPGGLAVDGYQDFAIWNPVTNTLVDVYSLGAPPAGCSIVNIGAFQVSGDRTKILVASIDSDDTLCSFDINLMQGTVGKFLASIPSQFVPTPDGKRFFMMSEGGTVGVFDAGTVAQLGTFQGPLSDSVPPSPLGIQGAVMSLDGSTLYIADQQWDLVAYDTTTFAEKGWVPNYSIVDLQNTMVPGAVDETGLIVGPIGHGVSFLDGSQIQPGGTTPKIGLAPPTPATGPALGGTALQVATNNGSQVQNPFPALAQAYLGNAQLVGATTTTSGPNTFPTITGTTPPSSEGIIGDFTALFANNNVAIMPEAFSYGPSIVEVVSNSGTTDGGGTGAIVGYGFGQSPTDVQVTVGGNAAPVNTVFTSAPIIPYPFPVEGLTFTIPPGVSGPASITVTTANGSTTATGAFNYVQAAKSYALPGAALQAGVYDPYLHFYYFSDKTRIQVFSLFDEAWQTPITLPGTTANTQLLGLALSPDGTKLAVADYGDQMIYVLNPATPGSTQIYTLPPVDSQLTPCGLAILNSGIVYFATVGVDVSGARALHKLDTTSGTITDFDTIGDGMAEDMDTRMILSPDGTHVYSQVDGIVLDIDTSTDQVTEGISASSSGGGNLEMSVSADGSTIASNAYFADENMNPFGIQAYADRETWLAVATEGQKLNKDGSVFFQPLANGIDVIDVQTGRLVNRVELPVQLPLVYDSLVVDGQDEVLVAITSTGIATVDLSSAVPAPAVRVKAMNEVSSVPTDNAQAAAQIQAGKVNGLLSLRPQIKRAAQSALTHTTPQ